MNTYERMAVKGANNILALLWKWYWPQGTLWNCLGDCRCPQTNSENHTIQKLFQVCNQTIPVTRMFTEAVLGKCGNEPNAHQDSNRKMNCGKCTQKNTAQSKAKWIATAISINTDGSPTCKKGQKKGITREYIMIGLSQVLRVQKQTKIKQCRVGMHTWVHKELDHRHLFWGGRGQQV